MQWDSSVNGGFNEGHATWQGIHSHYHEINVEKDLNSYPSIYHYYKKLLALKRTNPVAIYGETFEYDHANRKIIAYSRTYKGKRLFVAGNFSSKPVKYTLPQWLSKRKVLLTNYEGVIPSDMTLEFKPYQAIVFEELK